MTPLPLVALDGAPGAGVTALASALGAALAGVAAVAERPPADAPVVALVLALGVGDGVDPGTAARLAAAEDNGTPRVAALTKVDRVAGGDDAPGPLALLGAGAPDVDEALALARRLLGGPGGEAVVPVALPLLDHDDDGREEVAGLLTLLDLQVRPAGGVPRDADPEHRALVGPLHEELAELLGDGTPAELWAELVASTASGVLVLAVPVVAAPGGLGVALLAELLRDLLAALA